MPVLLGACGLSAALLYLNDKFLAKKPETLTPQFRGATERIGPVSERVAAPPGWRNPLRDRIPGGITGPDDQR
jgi:hypothetical protein